MRRAHAILLDLADIEDSLTSVRQLRRHAGALPYGHSPVRSPSIVMRELMLWPPIATLVVTSAV